MNVTDAMIERAMNASMPGGSAAWVWLFNCEGGMTPEQKHRDWFRRVLEAAALSHAAGQEVVDLEAFRKPVTAWRALASIGEIATEMPMRFKRTADEYRARVAEADRLLAIIDTAVARSEGEG